MVMCACCVAWANADLEAKELSPRDIYGQASPAVVMVMGHSDGGKTGSGEPVRSSRPTGWFSRMRTSSSRNEQGKPYPPLSVFLKPPRVTGDSEWISRGCYRAKVVAYSTPLDLAILKLGGALRRCRLSRSASPRMAESVIECLNRASRAGWSVDLNDRRDQRRDGQFQRGQRQTRLSDRDRVKSRKFRRAFVG